MRRTGSNSGAVGQLIGGGAEGPLSSSINVRISSTQRGGYGTGTGSSGGGGGGGGGAAGGRSSAARDAYSSSTGHGRAGNSTGVASRTSSRTLKRPSSSGSKRSTGAASDSSMQQQHRTTTSGAGGGAGAQAISVPRHAAAIAPAVREYLGKPGGVQPQSGTTAYSQVWLVCGHRRQDGRVHSNAQRHVTAARDSASGPSSVLSHIVTKR